MFDEDSSKYRVRSDLRFFSSTLTSQAERMRNDVKFSSFSFSKFPTQMLRPLFKPESSRRSPNPLNIKCTHFIKLRYYHGPNRVLQKWLYAYSGFVSTNGTRVLRINVQALSRIRGLEAKPEAKRVSPHAKAQLISTSACTFPPECLTEL